MNKELQELVKNKVDLELKIAKMIKEFEETYDNRIIVETVNTRRYSSIGVNDGVQVKVDVWVKRCLQ